MRISEETKQNIVFAGMILLIITYAFFATGCCMSPYWKGCGASDSDRMREQTECGVKTLALPLVNFPRSEMSANNQVADELRRLRDFVQQIVPGAQVVITPHDRELDPPWERLPFTWRDMFIWIKRPIVYDEPPMNRRMREDA